MKVLLVGPTRLYKIICIHTLLLLATYSWAQTSILTAEDQAIVNNAKKIREQSKDMTIPKDYTELEAKYGVEVLESEIN